MAEQNTNTSTGGHNAEIEDQTDGTESRSEKADESYYPMNRGRRGDCIIFANKKFEERKQKERESAKWDATLCENAFKELGFKVEQHADLRKKELLNTLLEVSKRDHSKCDALVVVFMSHGTVAAGQEFVCTRDDQIPTCELWEPFAPDRCPSLEGKPKLFFIQACRGAALDKGVRVTTDSASSQRPPRKSAVPVLADHLVMWASAENHYAFRTRQYSGKKEESVFIHFLEIALSTHAHLTDVLLKVSRDVAVEFQSVNSQYPEYHGNKQAPSTSSTLLRNICFSGGCNKCR